MPNQELLEISYSSPKFSLEWGEEKNSVLLQKLCIGREE